MAEQATASERLAQAVQEGHSLCWHCKEEVREEPQCPHCVKLQPLGHTSDHFSVMGLPRKLEVDARLLEAVFHALSRRFHPDVYRMASPRERIIALENSAQLNQAYRTLRDPFERTAYLLQLMEGRERGSQATPPQDLFEEILEVQELLAEFQFADPDEKAELRPKLDARRAALQAEQDRRAAELTGRLFREWDALQDRPTPPTHEEQAPLLEAMRRIIGERAYLKRVLNSLNDALNAG